MTLKEIGLWSYLNKGGGSRTEIHCPPGLQVSIEEFANELKTQIEANSLPAQAELCLVNWDGASAHQPRVLVEYTGNNAPKDIFQYVISLDNMGSFTYVEEKIYLRPPQWSHKPSRELMEREQTSYWSLFFGGIVSMLGLMIFNLALNGHDLVFFAASILAIIAGFWILIEAGNQSGIIDRKNKAIDQWNAQARAEQQAWDSVLPNWRKHVLETAYLSSTNDVLGRFTLAVSSTVKQVVKKLFEDRQAEIHRQAEQEKTQKELEEEVEKRFQDFR